MVVHQSLRWLNPDAEVETAGFVVSVPTVTDLDIVSTSHVWVYKRVRIYAHPE